MSYRDDGVYHRLRNLLTGKLCADAWKQWTGIRPLDVAMSVEYLNYKPFERARVVAQVALRAGDRRTGTTAYKVLAHVHGDLDAARDEAQRCRAEGLIPSAGPPLHVDAETHACLWTLPNAPNLKELAWLQKPEGFSQLLPDEERDAIPNQLVTAPKLMRYVPLRRALLFWEHPAELTSYYAKLFAHPGAEGKAACYRVINQTVQAERLAFSVPEPVTFHPDYATLLMTSLRGGRLTGNLRTASGRVLRRIGHALAQLHDSSARPTEAWSIETEWFDLTRHMSGVKRALPFLARRLDGVLDVLDQTREDLDFNAGCPIHGNLFGDQILVHNGTVGIVDWDDLRLGDPLFDVGRLIAHLVFRSQREGTAPSLVQQRIGELLSGYARAGSQRLELRRLGWHISAALLLRAKISSLRKLAPGWEGHLEGAVAEAGKVLAGSSAFVRLPRNALSDSRKREVWA